MNKIVSSKYAHTKMHNGQNWEQNMKKYILKENPWKILIIIIIK